ncbi:MAG: cysteine desulfurase-like protein [Acidobacteria bacterium]|nr:cysteine desulfurase-like protein [Acidobacteriota bacterium]
MNFDIGWVRAQFPSLSEPINGHPPAFLDGPGGTQVPQRVIDAITDYLKYSNANTAGAYPTSQRTDRIIADARRAMADFLGCDTDEIVFGPNMTTLTFALSRSIGRQLGPGNEIVVTHLDHDANISPWRALEERGATIRFVDIDPNDCTLDMADLARKIDGHTRLVSLGYASNAVGTINHVRQIIDMAHQAGAMVFLDAVHYGPHGLIDVRELDCDFLVCSAYKFFGPHMGVLYGKREHLKRLHPYKVRANSDAIPNRWEWGTLNHELIAGITACVEYLADLGQHAAPGASERRACLRAAYEAIGGHERVLSERMLCGLRHLSGAKVYGITDPRRGAERCPTFAIRIPGHTPLELAAKLGERGFFTWDGNYYALNLTERLNVERTGGFLRIGLVHYNTAEEVDGVLAALQQIAG